MATLTPQAQTGLDYLKTLNPTLAESISKSFSTPSKDPIDASTLNNTSNVSVPPPPVTPIPDITSYELPEIQNTAQQNKLDAERIGLENDVDTAYAQLGTKSARKAALETSQGIPGLNSQLNEINKQMRTLNADALQARETSENRRAPTFAIVGEQAAIERQRAVRYYGLSAASEALQGNITLAKDNVDRALDAEFGHLEKQIEHKLTLLTRNKDNFDREETRAAEQRRMELERAKDELAEARKNKEDVNSVMMIAAQFGATNDVLNKILASGDMQSAILAAGQYIQDPKAKYELEGLKLTNELRRAQIATEKAQAAKIRAETITTDNGVVIPSVSDTGSPASGLKAGVVEAITKLKLNEGQGNAVSYAFRMIEANSNINNLVGNGSTETGTYNPTTLASSIGRGLRTNNARTLERDLENFIRAQLRKESGAQISPEEMGGGKKIYSPQGVRTNANDIKATKETREQAIQSMIAQAGPAGKYLNQYFEYMQTGGLSSEERSIIYGSSPSMTSSTAPIKSGLSYY